MANYKKHPKSTRSTLLLVADSGAGKTGSLAALANSGYKVRVVDFDNGLDILDDYLTDKGKANVSYVTLKDEMLGRPVAWQRFKDLIWKGWKDEDEDLGNVKDWGEDTVLVVDSLSFAGKAACHEALALNGKKSWDQLSQPEWGAAVRAVETMIDYLTSDALKCNVIMTTLPVGVDDSDGVTKQYPFVVTKNFSQNGVARYFNNVFGIRKKRDGTPFFRTVGDTRNEFKSSSPKKLESEEEFDLAAIFKKLQGGKK